MPITKRAVKKLKHDRARTQVNEKTRGLLKTVIKKTRKSPTQKTLTAAFTALDKAVKGGLIHKNAAARTKSRLSKLLKK